MFSRTFHVLFLSLFLSMISVTVQAETQAVFELSSSTFQQQKYNECILTIKQHGYYSITTKAKYPASFVLVNQLTGPSEPTSESQDARMDVLLDEGRYKIRLYSSVITEDSMQLEVHPYKERNQGEPLVLIPNQFIETELGDREQLSYWIEVASDNQPIYMQMQGRNLTKALIWKDGSWLEDVKAFQNSVELEPGRALTTLNFNTQLKKGFYKITAYGGPQKKWTEQSDKEPFRLHYGLEEINPNSRFAGTLSPFGVNYYLINGAADFFLLQANEKKSYTLKVLRLSPNINLDNFEENRWIDKNSRTPQCLIQRSFNNTQILVKVQGKPGDPFVLQTLYQRGSPSFKPPKSGKYWISTVHSGILGDQVDASGLLVATDAKYGDTVVAKDMPVLNKNQGWTRSFNLLESVTLFFDIDDAGDYEIDLSGTSAEFRVEPFLTSAQKNYRSPDYETGKQTKRLEKGIYLFSIRPTLKGILDFRITPKAFSLSKKMETPIQGNLQISNLEISSMNSYKLYMGLQGECKYGLQVRELPLDLKQPLSVYLKPGQSVDLPCTVAVPSVVRVLSESGTPYGLRENTKDLLLTSTELCVGEHKLTLENKGKKTEMFSLSFLDISSLPSSKPKELPAEAFSSFPAFETITAGKVKYLDLESGGRKIFLLKVEKAGIYKVQSTGLLKTKATMRDRFNPFLASASANGSGRNFLLQSYLKEGIYQINVETLNNSAGRLGVLLEYIPAREGGFLVLEKTMKATVFPGESLIYTFDVGDDSNYYLRTIGMGREYPSRLEDNEGYPVFRPGQTTDFNMQFRPGNYRLISLPQEVEGKRLTSFSKMRESVVVTGKGPIPLSLNSTHANTWNEGEGTNREPDRYTFSLPAKVPLTINFNENMMAALYFVKEGKRELVQKIYSAKESQMWLEAGSYALELLAMRKGNLQDYSLSLFTHYLVDGLSYNVQAGERILISVNEPSLVEIKSEGSTDVYAELLDNNGRVIDVVDDSLNDWNFIISKTLEAGYYELKIASREEYGETKVSMNILKSIERKGLAPVLNQSHGLEGRKNIHPLVVPSGFYQIKIDGNSEVALSILEQKKESWVDMAVSSGQKYNKTFYLPPLGNYGLALWSLDHIDENIDLSLQPFAAQPVNITALGEGQFFSPKQGFVAVSIDHPLPASYRVICVDSETGEKIRDLSYATFRDPKSPLVWSSMRNELISTAGGKLYINISCEKRVHLTLSPLLLKENERLGLSLKGKERAFFPIESKPMGVHLVMAKGGAGQPLISWTGGASTIRLEDGTLVNNGFSFHHASSLAVILESSPGPVVVWNPLNENSESAIELNYYSLEMVTPKLLKGRDENQLASKKSISYQLVADAHFEVALPPGMAAFTWNEKGVTELYYSFQEQELFHFKKRANKITIVNLAKSDTLFHIDSRKSIPTFQRGSMLVENIFNRSGYLEDEVTVSKELTGLYSTPNLRISLLDKSGNLRVAKDGEPLEIDAGFYRYVIEYKAEYSKAWMGNQSHSERWGFKKSSESTTLQVPGFVNLTEAKWYKIGNDNAPTVVQISSQNDFVAALAVDEKITSVKEVTGPNSAVLYLPSGGAQVGLRAKARADGGGGNAYLNWRSVEEIQKNNGRKMILTDNDARGFSFQLEARQEIALGYNAPSDLIDCTLINSKGEVLAEGTVLFKTLEAGDYVVVYNLREELNFSEFTPIYVNTKTIEDQILADKIHEFLKKYGYIKGKK